MRIFTNSISIGNKFVIIAFWNQGIDQDSLWIIRTWENIAALCKRDDNTKEYEERTGVFEVTIMELRHEPIFSHLHDLRNEVTHLTYLFKPENVPQCNNKIQREKLKLHYQIKWKINCLKKHMGEVAKGTLIEKTSCAENDRSFKDEAFHKSVVKGLCKFNKSDNKQSNYAAWLWYLIFMFQIYCSKDKHCSIWESQIFESALVKKIKEHMIKEPNSGL